MERFRKLIGITVSLILVLSLCACGGQNGVDSAEESGPVETEESQSEDIYNKPFTPMEIPSREKAYKLSNTYSKIKGGETLKVAYFGGSVTGGTGSTDADKYSWRALTTAYLKSISKGGVEEIDASIGGAGSYLGAARFENDVVSKNPDLLFIEFAINDVYSDISADLSKANLEYMINCLYSENPYADIIVVLVTNKSAYGKQYSSYKAHREVADYYGIPIVDLGGEFYNKFEGSNGRFIRYFLDSVHPVDDGYQIYADFIIEALKELMVDAPAAEHTLPEKKLCKNGYSTLENIKAESINDKNWDRFPWFNNTEYEKEGSQFRRGSLKIQFPEYLAPKATGSTLTIKFMGNSFGFLGTVKENASLKFVLDGKKKKTVKGSDGGNTVEYPVFENLKNASHTMKITVTGENPYAAIAAFVVTK